MNKSNFYYRTNICNISDICNIQRQFITNNLNSKHVPDGCLDDDKLPHIILFPKFHKPVLSQRFVVSYSNCLIKPLARHLTLALKAVYQQVCSYSNMLFKCTGIKRNWIIDNNSPILDCLSAININSRARNINTYDFTLYTNLAHSDIKLALSNVIKLSFKPLKSTA